MNGKLIAKDEKGTELTILLDQPVSFKLGLDITVYQTKNIRTLKQNSTYWLYLTWCIDSAGGDLQSAGYFSIDGLHENIKEYIKIKHPQDFKIDKHFTTTTLSRAEFTKFWEIINQELMVEYFGLDTSPFWKDLDRFTEWQTTNPGGMKEYLKERMPF